MSVEQTEVIDSIGIDNKSGEVVLTIMDHLGWENDAKHHMFLLQGKINAYLKFIESEEILQSYPDSEGRRISIDIIGQFQLSAEARIFVKRASVVLSNAGVTLRFEHISD